MIMEIEIFSPTTEDLVMPKEGRVFATFKSRLAATKEEFRLSSPDDRLIFTLDSPLGKSIDLGTYLAGTRLTFALKTDKGYTYYTDQIKNPDVIHKGQKLKIPQKADLTKEEKSAVRKYWSKKNAHAAAAKP